MNLRGTQSLALLLWGWQSDLLLFAIPMAIIWEARFFLDRRWNVTKKDFYLLADLTSVCFVLMAGFLFLNRADYHFLRTLAQWLPILYFPLVVTLGYSTQERLTLDVLLYTLRRQKQPVTQSWDLDYLLFGYLIIASGTSKDLGIWYFPIVSLLIFLALLPLRSKRYQINIWILCCAMVFIAAFMTQTSIRETHIELRKRAQVWLAEWIQQRTNPLKSHTAIGQIGQLKMSDKILYRIPPPNDKAMPLYLHEASYDFLTGSSWSVLETDFTVVEPIDDFLWEIQRFTKEENIQLDIYHEFDREKAVIAKPPGTTRIQSLPAIDIQQNYYGAVQGLGLVPSPIYKVYFDSSTSFSNSPTPADYEVNDSYESLIQRVLEDNQLDQDNPVLSVRQFFADFRYSLFQPHELVSDPVEDFLIHRKSGHCEFFATTTVLLLRQMGIPARYVTGYSIQEYDGLLDMYVVRQRHAHAWAIAYINGEWIAVDTTPAAWLAEEDAQSTLLQPLLDFVSNSTFLFQIWWNEQKLEDYEIYLYLIGVILGLFLLWRISTGEQVVIGGNRGDAYNESAPNYPVSPLADIEQLLTLQGLNRQPGELFSTWFTRIGHHELLALLPLHNKLRFHPHGLSEDEQEMLLQLIESATDKLQQKYQEVGSTA